MRYSKILLIGVFSAMASVVACGGGSTSGTNGGSGSTGASGSGSTGGGTSGGNCSSTLSAGTYTLHETAQGGGTNCPTPPDETVSVGANETPNFGSMVSMGLGDAGACTVNESACSIMEMCSEDVGGATSQFTFSFTIGNDSLTGTETIDVTDMGTSINCTYNFSLTKN